MESDLLNNWGSNRVINIQKSKLSVFIKDQYVFDDGESNEKWNRGLDIFIESYQPDPYPVNVLIIKVLS